MPLLFVISFIIFAISDRIENGWLALSVIVVFVLGMYALRKYREWKLKKYLGERLYSWVKQRELSKGIYKYLKHSIGF